MDEQEQQEQQREQLAKETKNLMFHIKEKEEQEQKRRQQELKQQQELKLAQEEDLKRQNVELEQQPALEDIEKKSETIKVDEVLADKELSVLSNSVVINVISDIYLAMNLHHLKKAKFAIENDDSFNTLAYLGDNFSEKYSNDDTDIDFENQKLLTIFVFWNSIVLPSLNHYCSGRYVKGDTFLHHNRSLDDTDFIFYADEGGGDSISIRLANHRLTIVGDYGHTRWILNVKLDREPISATQRYTKGDTKESVYHLDSRLCLVPMIYSLENLFTKFGTFLGRK